MRTGYWRVQASLAVERQARWTQQTVGLVYLRLRTRAQRYIKMK